jgi:hypothetical protein
MSEIKMPKIDEAIQNCSERCLKAENIFAEIDAFFLELEASGEWADAELQEVEEGVVGLFFGILDCAVYPGELADPQPNSAQRLPAEAAC